MNASAVTPPSNQASFFSSFSFKFINIVWFCSHWLAMSNSCVNPFIYFFCHVRNKYLCASSYSAQISSG